jgi:hypothetical protein
MRTVFDGWEREASNKFQPKPCNKEAFMMFNRCSKSLYETIQILGVLDRGAHDLP